MLRRFVDSHPHHMQGDQPVSTYVFLLKKDDKRFRRFSAKRGLKDAKRTCGRSLSCNSS